MTDERTIDRFKRMIETQQARIIAQEAEIQALRAWAAGRAKTEIRRHNRYGIELAGLRADLNVAFRVLNACEGVADADLRPGCVAELQAACVGALVTLEATYNHGLRRDEVVRGTIAILRAALARAAGEEAGP